MSWLTWLPRIAAFAAWYAKAVVVSSAAVIADNLTPGQDSTPGIAELRTDCRTDLETTLLAALITLTPGTLTVGVRDEGPGRGRTLYVHGLYHPDADSLRAELHEMEHRMLAAVRRAGVTR